MSNHYSTVHEHECKDREDDVCGPRGHCVCECGATQRWFNNERLNDPATKEAAPWVEPEPEETEDEVIARERLVHTGYLTPEGELTAKGQAVDGLVRKVELGSVREFRESGELPWFVYRRPYDQMRVRGVAIVLLGYEYETAPVFNLGRRTIRRDRDRPWPDFRALRPFSCIVPAASRLAWIYAKAYAFANGWYSAEVANQEREHLDREYYWRRTLPPYELLKWAILDGEGFNDEDMEGGDYILACRAALQITKERYEPYQGRLR